MTDEEFKRWTRHTAENVLVQVADLQDRLSQATELLKLTTDERDLYFENGQTMGDEITSLTEQLATANVNLLRMADNVSLNGARINGLLTELDTAQALIDSMGGTEVGQRLRKEKRIADLQQKRDRLEREKAAADAELADLTDG